ncbi:WhiB family transcriptional regulator [Streptomyces hydrogenans]|uniref:WhiB family transcriptional regulator n=1 Tax=Streptomyces TaxID=1883 RepID=UPI003626FDCE
MTTETRRTITLAASTTRSADWRFAGACSTQESDEFFANRARALAASRERCLSCPVIKQCLTVALAQETGRYRWGVHGGLTPAQRLALEWEERLHGHRPDLDTAMLLNAPHWRNTLLAASRRPLDEAAAKLRAAGVDADAVTTRLALWWAGKPGARLEERTRPKESETDRLMRLYPQLIRQMRALGAAYRDIAAYLGSSEPLAKRAVSRLEKADREALETTEMEIAA